MSGRILYVSFDGVLQPLAFSQVVRPIAKLRERGYRYDLLTLERTADLADTARVEHVRAALGGAEWTAVPADLIGSARRSADAYSRIVARALTLARRDRPALVHARAHQGAIVAVALQVAMGVPYLFDVRGTWIEERPEWFGRPLAYAGGKVVERRFFEGASAYSTLTALLASDIEAGAFGPRGRMVRVVTTVADFDELGLRTPGAPPEDAPGGPPPELRAALRGRTVLGIVGSLNRSYAVDETLALARAVLARSERTYLLVLSQQTTAYREALERAGIRERASVHAVPHHAMRAWLPWLDWATLLLPDVAAKRGSMPTKLAELFACGVRPVAYGCNGEMMSWVRRTGSGVALEALDAASLDAAAARVARGEEDPQDLGRAREIARPHFSLEAGVGRYVELLEHVLPGRRANQLAEEPR